MPLPPPAILRDYTVISNRYIADDVFELALMPANPEDHIPDPIAGQWVMLHLLEPDGSVWGKSPYSIANACSEVIANGRVALAIRVSGAFTQRTATLRTGDAVKLQGPFGVFRLSAGAQRHAFFAGGIGIAPLRCMVLQSITDHPEIPIVLFASMRTAREAAFLDEFRALATSNSKVTFVPIFTRETDDSVQGERGHIDEALVRRHLGPPAGLDCYVCGPRSFMDEVMSILQNIGVSKSQIHSEKFG